MKKEKNYSRFILSRLPKVLILGLLLVAIIAGSFLLKRSQKGAEMTGESPSLQIEKEQEQENEEPRSEEEISRSKVPPEGKGDLYEGNSQPFFLQVFNPEDGLKLTTNQVIVRGQTLPGVEVFVNELETKADADGNFSLRVTLEEGENPLVISAGNESGEAEVERTVYYEK